MPFPPVVAEVRIERLHPLLHRLDELAGFIAFVGGRFRCIRHATLPPSVPSWPSETSVARLWLRRSVSVSGRSKACPFSIPVTPKVARPPPASMVGRWGAGLSSFLLRLRFRPALPFGQREFQKGGVSRIVASPRVISAA